MKKIFYLSTAFILCGMAQSQASCIQTPSCTSLGYASTTSCTDGLKCPFGNYWNCTHINKITELTNKITELEKTIITIKNENNLKSCTIGQILYSDKSCSNNLQSNKTPIAVIVYTDGQGHGQAIALKSIGTYKWSDIENDISLLKNNTSTLSAQSDYASCNNSTLIMNAGDNTVYPAVWAANEYSTEGTSAGDWCLPAAGIFNSVYSNMNSINAAIVKTNGEVMTSGYKAWSSSEYNYSTSWIAYFGPGPINTTYKPSAYAVRPVLEY